MGRSGPCAWVFFLLGRLYLRGIVRRLVCSTFVSGLLYSCAGSALLVRGVFSTLTGCLPYVLYLRAVSALRRLGSTFLLGPVYLDGGAALLL